LTRGDAVKLATRRRLTPERKLEIVFEMREVGLLLQGAALKLCCPELTDEEARRRVIAVGWNISKRIRPPFAFVL